MRILIFWLLTPPLFGQLVDCGLCLWLVERVGHGHGGEFRGLWLGRGDMVIGARACGEQRALCLYAITRGDFGARQLAFGANDGCGGAAYAQHGRYVGSFGRAGGR